MQRQQLDAPACTCVAYCLRLLPACMQIGGETGLRMLEEAIKDAKSMIKKQQAKLEARNKKLADEKEAAQQEASA